MPGRVWNLTSSDRHAYSMLQLAGVPTDERVHQEYVETDQRGGTDGAYLDTTF